MTPVDLAPEHLVPCILSAASWIISNSLNASSSFQPLGLVLLPLSEKSLVSSCWVCWLPCINGFLDNAYDPPDKGFWSCHWLPVMHSAHLSEDFPGAMTELTKPLDNIPQWPSCIWGARPYNWAPLGKWLNTGSSDKTRVRWGEFLRHLPQVQDIKGAQKWSNQYFEAIILKIKINAKHPYGQTIKILNKDKIGKSTQRKVYGFRCLFQRRRKV